MRRPLVGYRRPPLTPPQPKPSGREMPDRLGFLISSNCFFVHETCPQSTSFLVETNHFCCFDRLVEVTVCPTCAACQSPLLRLRGYVPSLVQLVTHRVYVCILIAKSFAILIFDSFVEHAVSEQYDAVHRDCAANCGTSPEAQVGYSFIGDYCGLNQPPS